MSEWQMLPQYMQMFKTTQISIVSVTENKHPCTENQNPYNKSWYEMLITKHDKELNSLQNFLLNKNINQRLKLYWKTKIVS